MHTFKEIHRNRLQKLAQFLEQENVNIAEKFDMEWFYTDDKINFRAAGEIISPNIKECGSAGCALGWAATVFPEALKECDTYDELSGWVCGLELSDMGRFSDEEKVWDYMFGSDWADNPIENTPIATAKRIYSVLTGRMG